MHSSSVSLSEANYLYHFDQVYDPSGHRHQNLGAERRIQEPPAMRETIQPFVLWANTCLMKQGKTMDLRYDSLNAASPPRITGVEYMRMTSYWLDHGYIRRHWSSLQFVVQQLSPYLKQQGCARTQSQQLSTYSENFRNIFQDASKRVVTWSKGS